MKDNNTNYCTLLHEKVQEEYNRLIARLSKMHSTEVLDHAYEKVIKQEIVSLLGAEGALSQEHAKGLYELPCPLAAIYEEWLENDYSFNDVLLDTIWDRASSEVGE